MKAIIRNGQPEIVAGAFTDNHGTLHPANVLTLWSEAELAAIDVYPVTDEAVPEGHVVTGSSLHWDGQTVTRVFTSQEISLTELQETKLQALAERRYQAEEGGTTFVGMPLATDRTSQSKIHAAYTKAKEDPDYVIANWKISPGVFTTLDAATIIAAGDAVRAHVQSCFDNEAILSAQITAATNKSELDAIDIEIGWP
jgi:hypothetical protein